MTDELKPYPEYKDSGLAWLGKIPAHWDVRRNGRLFAQRNETGYGELPILEVSLRTGVRVRDMDNLKRKQVMSDAEKYKRAAKGDIAYNMMRMWQGALGTAPVDGLVSPAYVVARPLEETNPRYFSYLFRTHAYMDEVDGYSRGIVKDRNRLYWQDFKRMPSCFPPPEEQAAIVRFLDANAVLVRQFIRNRRRLIEVLTEQKQAIINRAVTRGLDPNVPMKPSGVDWLGDVPEHWEVKKLGFLVETFGGMTPSKANASFWKGGVPWISPKDMKRDLISDSIDHISEDAIASTRMQLIAPPAILFVVRGMILARTFPVAQTTVPVTINQDMKALRPKGELTAAYLRFVLVGLSNAIHSLIEESGHGTRVLSTDAWANLSVLVPPRSEQDEICETIDENTRQIDEAVSIANQEITLVQAYRTRLVTDVVAGKIDLREIKSISEVQSEPADAMGDEVFDFDLTADPNLDNEVAHAND